MYLPFGSTTLLSTLSFLDRFLQNLIKEHYLDPITLFKQKQDGSGFKSPDPDRRKNKDPSGSRFDTLDLSLYRYTLIKNLL